MGGGVCRGLVTGKREGGGGYSLGKEGGWGGGDCRGLVIGKGGGREGL